MFRLPRWCIALALLLLVGLACGGGGGEAKAPAAPVLDADGLEAKTLYEELEAFKHDPDFVLNGFAPCCRFNKWQKRVETLRDKAGGGFVAKYGFAAGDISILGMSYVVGEYDTPYVKFVVDRIELGLGLR